MVGVHPVQLILTLLIWIEFVHIKDSQIIILDKWGDTNRCLTKSGMTSRSISLSYVQNASNYADN